MLIASGHELNIHESWVAQCYWTEHCSQRDDPNTDSVGIHLMGDDHTLMGVTVFDWVSVGIRIEQPMSGTGGNLLQGVHVWNGGTNGNVQGPGIAVSCSCPHLDRPSSTGGYAIRRGAHIAEAILGCDAVRR